MTKKENSATSAKSRLTFSMTPTNGQLPWGEVGRSSPVNQSLSQQLMARSKDKQDPSTGTGTSPKARPQAWRHEDSAGTKAPSPGPSSQKAAHRCGARRQAGAQPHRPPLPSRRQGEPEARADLGLWEPGWPCRAGKEAFIGSPMPQGSVPRDSGGDQGRDICTKA